ncbi:23S rRNA (adenine(1618)-N(6))-methyltransferase RlmF [Geothrix sp. PMB-07]|uniref:23S rRNA (adenine(1618)-N(6))-methyltransferase RlmF n=1 Tax=Geothrix sp. PMB-07 TaxID=3068640 RepID=UPI0027407C09|nr:23S rRNA (adenine(1618)-N(6))-methyltransferase RlmF [Geothrix sp. PMB-07]WLT32310.1 23S rRNA (adenine(1618)-N(6))-methyltransferase RlmF [Geothrix sp. PMB-07]
MGIPRQSASPRPAKPGLHPRNRHAAGYDFQRLVAASPELGPFLRKAPHGGLSIDFANPAAVKALNRALLAEAYGIRGWDIPSGYLCPPIPGRSDYLHHLADLLAEDANGVPPRGPGLRVLDVGVGANAIYPLVGHREYGWSFVGSDIDAAALASASRILAANPEWSGAIELRHQADPTAIFRGVVRPGERFDLTLCNPPFHGSAREAREAAEQKWRKLGKNAGGSARNFGGQGPELWCEGGEAGFIRRMIAEGLDLGDRVGWFTSLVSSSKSLPAIHRALRHAEAREIRTVAMAQGQKQSRFVAWSFLDVAARRAFHPTSTPELA